METDSFEKRRMKQFFTIRVDLGVDALEAELHTEHSTVVLPHSQAFWHLYNNAHIWE